MATPQDDEGLRPVEGEPAAGPPSGDLRRLVFYSLMTGLCPLIPVPLVDDWVRDLLRRRLAGDLAVRRGLDLDGAEIRILACGHHPPSVKGCVRGCFALTLIKPISKIVLKVLTKVFRKILVFLMIKDSVDTFSETFHEAYLLRHALALGRLDGLPAPVVEARWAIEAAVAETDHRPIEQLARRTFRSSWRLIRQGARRLTGLSRELRREGGRTEDELPGELDLSEEEKAMGSLVDELTEGLEGESGYLRRLEARLEKHLNAEDSLSISK